MSLSSPSSLGKFGPVKILRSGERRKRNPDSQCQAPKHTPMQPHEKEGLAPLPHIFITYLALVSYLEKPQSWNLDRREKAREYSWETCEGASGEGLRTMLRYRDRVDHLNLSLAIQTHSLDFTDTGGTSDLQLDKVQREKKLIGDTRNCMEPPSTQQ